MKNSVLRPLTNMSKSDFIGKSSILFFATILANVLSLLGIIMLTKIYSMEILGEFFAVIAITSVLTILLHAGFIQAIPLMNEEELKVGVSLLTVVSAIVFGLSLLCLLLSQYLFVLAMAAAISNLGALLEITLIREGRVRFIAAYRIALPISSFTLILIYSQSLTVNAYWLALSYYVGMLLLVLYSATLVLVPLLVKLKPVQVIKLIRTYNRFPRYIGPGLLFHAAAFNLPIFVGLHYFGGATISAYTLAYRFVIAPMNVLGQALGQAYTSKLSQLYRHSNVLKTTFSLDSLLFSLAVIVSLLIYFIFPWVSQWLFDDNHIQISEYAFALIPLVFSMLSVAPLSNLFQFTNRQRMILGVQLITFLSSLASFFIGVLLNSFMTAVVIFSLMTLLKYGWVYFEIIKVRNGEA
ncbi:hypothetical protein MNBD_GAMMA12-1273 [hydrothermal vent metagenome]|uniref:Uncharacterized protein n=1 Tax=hydrothermal vent metagenome TaxID=652676 RepID=A0A3B0Y6Y4_9ZZZZ